MQQTELTKIEMVDTDRIVVVSNPRNEYGDIEGLAADIALRGLVEPLIVNEKRELVDGHRRLLALRRNKAMTAPCIIEPGLTPAMTEEIKLVTSLHKKNLTPLEEGRAFAAYLAAHKVEPEELAKRINKSKRYVEERLQLNGLTPETVTGLRDRKIELGHAQIIAQLPAAQQKACVKEIIEQEYTVQQFSDVIRFNPHIDFGDLPVRLQERWGGSQTTLDCAELLDTKTDRNDVLQAKMKKELAEYLEAEREKVRAKGITVYASASELLAKHPKAERVTEYDEYADIYKDVLKELPTSKRFAVVIDFDQTLDKTIYCLEPKEVWAEVEAKHKATTAKRDGKKSQQQLAAEHEEADQLLATTREERLRKNVAEYRHTWMIEKTRVLTVQGSVIAKAVLLQVLMEHITDSWKRKTDEYGERLYAEMAKAAGRKTAEGDDGYHGTLGMNEYLKIPASELDGSLHRAALAYAHQEDDKWLNTVIGALSVDYAREFVLTSEYLDLYTKEQLLGLAKEAKVNAFTKDELAKKATLIAAILKRAPKGFVPKDFVKAGRVSA
jgi:ParB/RepB/Spo0J family partition protein